MKYLPSQEHSSGMEADQLWFLPPCPQLGDTNLRSALVELRPAFPSPDQESFPAPTGLSFGSSSQGSRSTPGPAGWIPAEAAGR